MLLTVDVGNTNIVIGLYTGRGASAELVSDWRMRTDTRVTADELALSVRGMLAENADTVTGICALSTVPSVLRELRVMFARYYELVPTVIIEPGVRTGLPLRVDNPKEVGPDRIANAVAAHELYGGPCVVVDFGTSTVVDAVSARGEFLGGAFAPGVEISLDALASRASALREVELVPPRSVIGKTTVECLQSGILYGFAGQVDGLVRRFQHELCADTQFTAEDVAVIATGGLAPLMIGECGSVTEHRPDLTMAGLRLAYERNVR
ncbi:type III pantothenate kinase [Haloechinothrix alba]|uniref:Type III pantothenate kinase n=1 Tax=Haloechinothrix alba TaxID=664784 RepID=A0A238XUH9_9PSEU|nr:type III pantothenate kinase [Haloechinothrix alba]SNR62004.1 type III pantothenate kinase [Haloechinothrix alba]